MKLNSIKYFSRVLFLCFTLSCLFISNSYCQKKYSINYQFDGKDTSFKIEQLALKTTFDGKQFAEAYINTLPATLISKGFPGASVDSVTFDSTSAKVDLYLGEQYKWLEINTNSIDERSGI